MIMTVNVCVHDSTSDDARESRKDPRHWMLASFQPGDPRRVPASRLASAWLDQADAKTDGGVSAAHVAPDNIARPS